MFMRLSDAAYADKAEYLHLHYLEETMMPTRISLTVTQGSLEGKEFVVTKRGRYVIGRAEDCDICLTGTNAASVSRRHCVLSVEPPALSVRDLASRNGTIVNGENIGQRSESDPPESAPDDSFLEYALHDGDTLRLGSTVFRIGIFDTSQSEQPAYAPHGFA
jgi:pSer/pThr/pTyr-binding forkhead associated (FHA) protein